MSKIKVRAKIKPKEQVIKLYFKSFDVDDPSSDVAPIDTNGIAQLGVRRQ